MLEKGMLPIGVMFNEERLRLFTLRPLKVKDTFSAQASPDADRLGDENMLGLYLLGRRLTIDGLPPELICLDFMLDLYDGDLAEIMAADGRLANAVSSFRGQQNGIAAQAGAGADDDGLFRG